MPAAALSRDALLPRADGRFGLGAALALLAHAGLIGALALGLNWRLPRQTAVVSAELWAAVPQAAAPAPAPEVIPPPQPPPAPAAVPVKPALPPPPSAAEREAEIALEKAAKRRQEQLAREAQAASEARVAREAAERERLRNEQEEAQRQKLKLEKKLQDQRLADDKAQALKRDKLAKEEKAREDKRKQDLADQRERQQKEAEAKRQDALVAKQREENLKRMLGQAGATGATGAAGATGNASAAAGPSSGYAGRVSARIKGNIIKATEVAGNPITEVEVKCAPDGAIVGRRIVKPSGNPAWDEIVLRAIDRTAVLPRDTDGRIPATMLLSFSRQE